MHILGWDGTYEDDGLPRYNVVQSGREKNRVEFTCIAQILLWAKPKYAEYGIIQVQKLISCIDIH